MKTPGSGEEVKPDPTKASSINEPTESDRVLSKSETLAQQEAAKVATEVEEEVEESYEEEEYDEVDIEVGKEPSGSRLQLYTPSSLLNWGQFEAKYFQQIYTQNKFFDPAGEVQPQGARTTYYSGIGNFTLGYNSRLNFGFDFWVQSVLIGDEDSSPFGILKFPAASATSRTALTTIGPKVKWQPFERIGDFTVQSSFLIPIAKDPQGEMNGRPYLASKNFLWWTQLFYTLNFHDNWQLFTELDIYWNIDKKFDFQNGGFFALPASAFLSYFPTSKLTFYVNSQFWPTLGENVVSSWWFQMGLGAKYQLSSSVDLEISHGRFLAGRGAAGPARTYNLGVRFVKF